MSTSPDRLAARYFDGVSARGREAEVWIDGDQLRIAAGDDTPDAIPVRHVQWPERQRHGARQAHLRDGGALHFGDPLAFDHWARRNGLNESWVVKTQQSWRWTASATLALLALCGALYAWGLPLGSRAVLAFVPETFDKELGELVMRSVQSEGWLQPTELSAGQQQRLRAAWARAAAKAGPPVAHIDLHFNKSSLGPNAFALPGGTVVMTDEMVKLVDGHEDMVVGVLAHEAAHVQHRHGMRMLVQATLLGTVTSIAFGDFSSLFAAAPALLGHLAYSRDHEREADGEAIALLQANGIPPSVMATMFERLRDHQREAGMPSLPIALGSHPPDDERIARFRSAPAGR
jgi:Zn-dependent protease with chaperone function